MAHIKASLGETDYRVAISAGPHQIASDEPAARGGGDTGPTPFDLVAAGLASCTIITLRMYAERKGWSLGTIHADLQLTRSARQTSVARTLRFGAELSQEQLARLAEIAEKTPVTLALKAGMEITTTIAPSLPEETAEHLDRRLDEALEESFPASDPPSISRIDNE